MKIYRKKYLEEKNKPKTMAEKNVKQKGLKNNGR